MLEGNIIRNRHGESNRLMIREPSGSKINQSQVIGVFENESCDRGNGDVFPIFGFMKTNKTFGRGDVQDKTNRTNVLAQSQKYTPGIM